jgi:hypothetical protein
MAFIVEMSRGEPHTPTFASFSCGKNAWKDLLSIARTFGWFPMGTVHDPYAARFTKDYEKDFVPDYSPEEWAYCKRIDDADALKLSAALKRAAKSIREGNVVVLERSGPTLIKGDITDNELRRVNQLPTELLESFAQFAGGGGFVFAWDD